MQHPPIVPQHHLSRRPVVEILAAWGDDMLDNLAEQRIALLVLHPLDAVGKPGRDVDHLAAGFRLDDVTLYPKPIGFQAEYNIGKGPELDGKIVKDSFLNGGYAMLFARVPTSFGTFVPYVRGQYYHGGRKTETNAPLTIVKEVEAGVEWQVWKPFELTMAFTASDRETNRKGLTGEFLRLQAQINY